MATTKCPSFEEIVAHVYCDHDGISFSECMDRMAGMNRHLMECEECFDTYEKLLNLQDAFQRYLIARDLRV